MTHNGPPEHPIHQVEIWERLYLRDRPVGFKKTISTTVLFSSDGYGWSGSTIEHDAVRRQIPLPLYAQRVFHGDVVRMPPFSGAQEITEQVLVLTPTNAVLCYDPQTDRLTPLHELWPPPSTPRVRSIVGPLESDSKLLRRVEDQALNADPPPGVYAFHLGVLTLAILGGLLGAAALQWTVMGSIGPIFSLIGAIAGGALFWMLARARDRNALRRQTVLKMGAHTGLVLMGIGATLALFRVTGGWGESLTEPSRAIFVAYGGLGFFCGLISTWVGGEMVAWRTGGFSDEQTEQHGFRNSS